MVVRVARDLRRFRCECLPQHLQRLLLFFVELEALPAAGSDQRFVKTPKLQLPAHDRPAKTVREVQLSGAVTVQDGVEHFRTAIEKVFVVLHVETDVVARENGES